MGFLNKLFGKKDNVRKRKGNPDVYDMPNENERMNWAMEKARLTLHYFKKCLANPKPSQDYFSVKAKIEDGTKVEHIWLMNPSFDNEGNVYGTIGNEPIDVKNVSINEKIGIPFEKVSDWMIIEQGRLIGGYTIRAIREGLSGEAITNFDNTIGGLHIDDGEDYFLSNLDTPEGAILMLEDAYDNDDLEKCISCKDFNKEAEFMLKKTVSVDIDTKIINSTAEVLKLSFIKSMQEHGMPKFKGIKRAFKRQKISNEHYIITEICYYPDGGISNQKLNTYKVNNQWKVLGLEN
ncbi:DUF2314 domain-containing protein [Cellulophaga baltica]|uniref:YegJ family protein n=1 Tax=Cellulophaga TaxID=104264 RepID=UPI001C077DA5|nr:MULTISPECIES: DUF2314 domain-containing protein [Cellulophaga]MBU2997137.1 DUF2314 domain-containing protein [Cellulophaga baltica]MDO6768535.1 DUF2314 domain-containing protein [Cellulophaga sp. 1_MG-2023]